MKNITLVLMPLILFGVSEKLSAQEVSPSDAQEMIAKSMQENCVQTLLRGKAEYPALARLARLEGKSLCKVSLDEQGRVVKAELLEERNPILDKEALRLLASETEFKTDCKRKELVVSVVFKLQ